MSGPLEQAVALLIGTAATVLLMYGNYRWGGKRRRNTRNEEDDDA